MTVQTMERVSADTLAIGVLERAADRIERDGFAQLQFFDSVTGRYCVLGAISAEAQLTLPDVGECDRAIYAAVTAVSMRVNRFLTTWNDVRGRTQAEVVGLLRGAAAELRAVTQ